MKKLSVLLMVGLVLGLGLLSVGASAEYASEVISFEVGEVLLGGDYDYYDPNNALGPPTTGNDFFSLGFGGYIVLGFDGLVTGELEIVEITGTRFGSDTYYEAVEVYVSRGEGRWIFVDTVTNGESGSWQRNTTLVDMPKGNYKYVKLIDVSERAAGRNGFDLTAVEAEVVTPGGSKCNNGIGNGNEECDPTPEGKPKGKGNQDEF
ncbi:MAG: hypothetical protein V5A57_03085 [Candidatus Paceibacterota bacterium]